MNCTEDELKNVIEEISQLNPNPGDFINEMVKDIIIPDILCYIEKGEWVLMNK